MGFERKNIYKILKIKKSKSIFENYAIEDFLALVPFIVLLAIVFLQFFTRYVINKSISWTEEVARYLLIMVVFLGSCMGVRKRTHCSMEFIYRKLPPDVGRIVYIIVDVINTIFLAFGVYLSIRIIPIMRNQYMAVLPYPMFYIYIPVMVGFIFMTFRSVQITIKHIRTRFVPDSSSNTNNLSEKKTKIK